MAEDMLGERPDPPAKKAKPPKSDGALQECIAAYVAGFGARFPGVKPRIGGKGGALMKRMIADWDRDTVLGIIRRFFTTTDSRVTRSGYEIGDLYYLAQYLQISDRRTDQRTAENIDAARRAMGKR